VKALKRLFHALGLGCLLGSSILAFVVMLTVAVRGYAVVNEPGIWVRWLELALLTFSLVYWPYLVYSRLKRQAKTP